MNNNNNNNIDIFDYKTFNNKNYNFKQLICNKLKININELKIDSLDDISKVASLICNEIPISNILIFEKGSQGIFTVDDIVDAIDSGGSCHYINILFGLLLFEFNIECQLVNKPKDLNLNLYQIGYNYHAANIIKWNDGKRYYFDIGAGTFTCLIPINIDDSAPVKPYFGNLPNALYRVIKYNHDPNNNTTYILQKKLIDHDKDYINILGFDLNKQVSIKEITDGFKEYNKYFHGSIYYHKVTSNGIFIYLDKSFTWITSKFKKEIIIKNKEQAESTLKKYFGVDLNDNRFLYHYKL